MIKIFADPPTGKLPGVPSRLVMVVPLKVLFAIKVPEVLTLFTTKALAPIKVSFN